MRRMLVDTSLGHVHLRCRNGTGRPLLALHMSPLSGLMYEELFGLLDRPAAAPDRPGFGFSDPLPEGTTMEELASVSLEVLDHLGWRDPVDVLGTHTGATEAVALARLAPERINAIGLVSVPFYTDAERRRRMAGRGAPRAVPAVDGSHLLDRWTARLSYRTPPYDLDYLHALTVAELQSPGPHLAYRAVFTYPMEDELPRVACKVVVFAPHDDLTEQTERARSLLPSGSVFLDLPELGLDVFHRPHVTTMDRLIREHLPAGDPS